MTQDIVPIQIIEPISCANQPKTSNKIAASIKKAPVPKPFISNIFGSASMITETMLQNYQQKVSSYRQEKFWDSLNFSISRDNICNWHLLSTKMVLQPLFNRLQKKLIQQNVLNADETNYTVIQRNKAKTYYWLFCSRTTEK